MYSDILAYYLLFVFVLFICFFVIVLFFSAYFLGPKNPTNEKVSPYECGFNPFEDARKTFDVKFYLVAILFIIFDVETVLLLPIISCFFLLDIYSLTTFFIILFILVLGFFYEWKKKALIWV